MYPIAYRIDLPCPPQEIVQQALACRDEFHLTPVDNIANKFDRDYTQRLVRLQGQSYITRYQKKYVIDGWQEWCRDNIDAACFHAGVAINDGPSGYHGPHVDAGRTWALFYMVEPGGSDVTTSWWRHPDHPVILNEDLYPRSSWDYDDLTLVTSEILVTGCWYLFHGRVLHSVENVRSRRISLQTNIHHIPSAHKGLYPIG